MSWNVSGHVRGAIKDIYIGGMDSPVDLQQSK